MRPHNRRNCRLAIARGNEPTRQDHIRERESRGGSAHSTDILVCDSLLQQRGWCIAMESNPWLSQYLWIRRVSIDALSLITQSLIFRCKNDCAHARSLTSASLESRRITERRRHCSASSYGSVKNPPCVPALSHAHARISSPLNEATFPRDTRPISSPFTITTDS